VSGWELVFLGVIAVSLVAMAIAQMIVAQQVAKVARQAAETAQEYRRELRPIVEKLHKITDDASRVTALALVQAERVDQFMATTAQRIDEAVTVVQDAVVQPIRHGAALLAGLQAALSLFGRGAPAARRHHDEEDAMFIG
jgi:hypothetical protein